jgi:xanthine dehydrogenase accessory factor
MGAHIYVLTHDHALDYSLTRAALTGGRFAYLGLIGSMTKRARFVSRLRAEGLDDGRLTCPIGVPQLRSKDPEVIAVSVAADLLMRLEA